MKTKRNLKKWMAVLFCIGLMSVFAAGTAHAAVQTVQIGTNAVKNGWKVLPNGEKRYFKKGEYVTGIRSIDGKRYFFNMKTGYLRKNCFVKDPEDEAKRYYASASGELYTNCMVKIGGDYYYFQKNSTAAANVWKTIDGKRYYFRGNCKAATGLSRISGRCYLFTDSGVLCYKTGFYSAGGVTYFFDKNAVMIFRTENGKYYDRMNEEMSFTDSKRFACFVHANSIVKTITNDSMSEEEKLRVCFDYIAAFEYKNTRTLAYYDGWDADFANDVFVNNGGDCISTACALAYLYKALGYPVVYYAVDSDNPPNGHAFTELNGLVYDTLFAQSAEHGGYERNYAAPYSLYLDGCQMRIEIMPEIK